MKHLEHEHAQPDAWHRHTAEEGLPQDEHGSRVDATAVGVVLACIMLCVVVVAVVVVIYLRSYRSELIEARQETTESRQAYLAYRAQQEAELSTYGWADQQRGFVAMPLEEGRKRVIEAYGG